MATFYEHIPYDKITKIKPVLALDGENITQVKARVGCTHIINFCTYNFSDRKLDSGLKLDGILEKTGYTCLGFAINGNKLAWSYEGQGFKDWFGHWSAYIKEGKLYNAAKTGANAWIGIGYNGTGIKIAGCNKASAMTPFEFMTTHFSDCTYAMLGDGSYSSQWITPKSSSGATRNVVCYICIWTEENTENEVEDMATKSVICTKKTSTYTVAGAKENFRYISPNDSCTIDTTLTDNLLIKITYPTGSTTRTAFIKDIANFT